jgi:hypothetical protein
MFCTAGVVVMWALTMQGVPVSKETPKVPLSCYTSKRECLDGWDAAANALRLASPVKTLLKCEREPETTEQ